MHIRTGPPECQKNSFLSFVKWFLVDLLSAIKHEIQTKMHIQGHAGLSKSLVGTSIRDRQYLPLFSDWNSCKKWWGTILKSSHVPAALYDIGRHILRHTCAQKIEYISEVTILMYVHQAVHGKRQDKANLFLRIVQPIIYT